jgi:ElaB/YqjD/DUF883 family membrane-anchored ribosome-binding protein
MLAHVPQRGRPVSTCGRRSSHSRTGEGAKERLRELAGATGEKLKDAAGTAEDMATDAAAQMREFGTQAPDAAGQLTAYLEKSLKEKPMQTLAGVAALAFVAGAIWKRLVGGAPRRFLTRAEASPS